MKKSYAVFEIVNKKTLIRRMSANKKELIDYRNSFPEEEKRKMWIAESNT